MHPTMYLTLGLAALIAPDFAAAVTQSDSSTSVSPSEASSILTAIRAKASSRATDSAFAAELSKIPEAKDHNIPSDIASFAGDLISATGTAEPPPPAWLTAAATTGAVYKFVMAELVGAQLFAADSDTTINTAGSSDTTSTGTSKSTSTATSTSTGATTTSTGTSKGTSTASSTSKSTGGAASQPTGAVVAVGAAAAGMLGLAALL